MEKDFCSSVFSSCSTVVFSIDSALVPFLFRLFDFFSLNRAEVGFSFDRATMDKKTQRVRNTANNIQVSNGTIQKVCIVGDNNQNIKDGQKVLICQPINIAIVSQQAGKALGKKEVVLGTGTIKSDKNGLYLQTDKILPTSAIEVKNNSMEKRKGVSLRKHKIKRNSKNPHGIYAKIIEE